MLNSRVTGVRKGEVDVVNAKTNTSEVIPFGACVWSTGVAMHPLVKKLQARPLPETHLTLEVLGALSTSMHLCQCLPMRVYKWSKRCVRHL